MRSTLKSGLESFIRHGEAVPPDVTIYDRETVHAELRELIRSTEWSQEETAESLSDWALIGELVKRGVLKVEMV